MREKKGRVDIQSEAYAGKPTMPQSVLIIGIRFARKHVSIARVPQALSGFPLQLSVKRRNDLQVVDCPSDHETKGSFSKLVGDPNFAFSCRINEVHHHLTELYPSFK